VNYSEEMRHWSTVYKLIFLQYRCESTTEHETFTSLLTVSPTSAPQEDCLLISTSPPSNAEYLRRFRRFIFRFLGSIDLASAFQLPFSSHPLNQATIDRFIDSILEFTLLRLPGLFNSCALNVFASILSNLTSDPQLRLIFDCFVEKSFYTAGQHRQRDGTQFRHRRERC
jgi:hypothetical protein